ncbi:hypothetical protein BS47DRAFT_1356041 [Hydnum rufescens UP504]|uniref:Uncharacterized protein n=1 Tax=Hydnum rufescens UP504 TaxID=1448309 RepID=A0A9P6ADM5_9AGAM|nr:hypothetical protein BS47DRAFT_1356041 [Hydnum rufescens UP504]
MHDTSRRPPLRQATKSKSRIPASNVQDQSDSVDGDLGWWFINQSKTVIYEKHR